MLQYVFEISINIVIVFIFNHNVYEWNFFLTYIGYAIEFKVNFRQLIDNLFIINSPSSD